MSIRLKLYIGFGIVLFVAVAMFAFSFISIRNFRNNFDETVAVQLQLEQLANDIRYFDVVLTDNVRSYLIDPQK
ncbi:MAG: hypothetical protein Q9P01_03655 [Anaerolineae bacterium]|nr:hypothetical protein [Anaerolineae bacterium]